MEEQNHPAFTIPTANTTTSLSSVLQVEVGAARSSSSSASLLLPWARYCWRQFVRAQPDFSVATAASSSSASSFSSSSRQHARQCSARSRPEGTLRQCVWIFHVLLQQIRPEHAALRPDPTGSTHAIPVSTCKDATVESGGQLDSDHDHPHHQPSSLTNDPDHQQEDWQLLWTLMVQLHEQQQRSKRPDELGQGHLPVHQVWWDLVYPVLLSTRTHPLDLDSPHGNQDEVEEEVDQEWQEALIDLLFLEDISLTTDHDTLTSSSFPATESSVERFLLAHLEQLQRCLFAERNVPLGASQATKRPTQRAYLIHCRLLARFYQWLSSRPFEAIYTIPSRQYEQPPQLQQRELMVQLLSAMVEALIYGLEQAVFVETGRAPHGMSHVHYSTATQGTGKGWLRPVTSDLLPILVQEINLLTQSPSLSQVQQPNGSITPAEDHPLVALLHRIWMTTGHLYNLCSAGSPSKEAEASSAEKATRDSTRWPASLAPVDPFLLTVVTTVLCMLVPSLLKFRLPIWQRSEDPAAVLNVDKMASGSQAATPPRPVHRHIQLWELIYQSLDQGIYAPKKLSWIDVSSGKAANGMGSPANSKREDATLSPLLRRRGLYLLRLLADDALSSRSTTDSSEDRARWQYWSKYVACFETLEMELESHLVDQVWDTVAGLFVRTASSTAVGTNMVTPPDLSWSWMSLLLGRIITSHDSPILRKLSLYRLLKGEAGIQIEPSLDGPVTNGGRKGQKAKGNLAKPASLSLRKGAPLGLVSTDFIFRVVLPAYDSLLTSVGLTMHQEVNGKVVREDMSLLLSQFLDCFLVTCQDDPYKLQDFFRRLWLPDIICVLHRKNTVQVFKSVESSLLLHQRVRFSLENDMLGSAVQSFQYLFSLGSIVPVQKEAIMRAFAAMLKHASNFNVGPLRILEVLSLFTSPGDDEELGDNRIAESPELSHLRTWLLAAGESNGVDPQTLGAALCASFVDGLLLGSDKQSSSSSSVAWDPLVGATDIERSIGGAVVLYCTLVSSSMAEMGASQLIWPAINKGLNRVQLAMHSGSWTSADRVMRALLLLECGCRFRVLSGIGNGDMLADHLTNQLMPPPPQIESLLGGTVNFLLHCMKELLIPAAGEIIYSHGARSSGARKLSSTFAKYIAVLRTLHKAYPSSLAISASVDNILNDTISMLRTAPSEGVHHADVLRVSLFFATLTSGAVLPKAEILPICRAIMSIQYYAQGGQLQPARSVFHYSKWGSLSCLIPQALGYLATDSPEARMFLADFFDVTADAVESVPTSALFPLFACLLSAARARFASGEQDLRLLDSDGVLYLQKVISALLRLFEDCKTTWEETQMLDEICRLVFDPELLLDEYLRLETDPCCLTPVRQAFRDLMLLGGTQKHHITRTVLSRITYGWLGSGHGSDRYGGRSAIPFRDDIVGLLIKKEECMEESSASQIGTNWKENLETTQLPGGTNETSLTRGFLLVFFSKVEDAELLCTPVLTNLVHHTIFQMLEIVRPLGQRMVMLGTTEYVIKSRGWQALCVLSRFVTSDIAEHVCRSTFDALVEPLHGQIRYFIEVFTIQCGRKHPVVFGKALVDHFALRDMSLQMVTSLMVISGNLVVGRYQADFFKQFDGNRNGVSGLSRILAGVIPWLSSTQGFSRAIAQLLVHKLIPLVLDVSKEVPNEGEDSDWYLRSVYYFLDENSEMKRLRRKQSRFFENYEVDQICTPEGVLGIPTDEGGEADPAHMVELMKDCLRQVYEEAHLQEAPAWKQVEAMLQTRPHSPDSKVVADGDDVVTFQRKIIPVDALNLALEEIREKRLQNAAGRTKQRLIVCASLIDKVPNLGGLARTSEIFAAEKLVVPDLRFTHMDNFTSLSVGAADWIEIEECKEENLLNWLHQRKLEGYFIVGLEQTSSSASLLDFRFPPKQPIVLLLGKEKEGIPVEFLHMVDQCVEIPQLGIIRSLNVHVSGALAIWELTKQRLLATSKV